MSPGAAIWGMAAILVLCAGLVCAGAVVARSLNRRFGSWWGR